MSNVNLFESQMISIQNPFEIHSKFMTHPSSIKNPLEINFVAKQLHFVEKNEEN